MLLHRISSGHFEFEIPPCRNNSLSSEERGPPGLVEVVEVDFGEVDEERLPPGDAVKAAVVDVDDGVESGVDIRHLDEGHPGAVGEELDPQHLRRRRRGGGGRVVLRRERVRGGGRQIVPKAFG